MHGLEHIIASNNAAARIVAAQQERLKQIVAQAHKICDAQLESDQTKAIAEMRKLITEPVKS
jgi:sensor domain CHASE-containing protein